MRHLVIGQSCAGPVNLNVVGQTQLKTSPCSLFIKVSIFTYFLKAYLLSVGVPHVVRWGGGLSVGAVAVVDGRAVAPLRLPQVEGFIRRSRQLLRVKIMKIRGKERERKIENKRERVLVRPNIANRWVNSPVSTDIEIDRKIERNIPENDQWLESGERERQIDRKIDKEI